MMKKWLHLTPRLWSVFKQQSLNTELRLQLPTVSKLPGSLARLEIPPVHDSAEGARGRLEVGLLRQTNLNTVYVCYTTGRLCPDPSMLPDRTVITLNCKQPCDTDNDR